MSVSAQRIQTTPTKGAPDFPDAVAMLRGLTEADLENVNGEILNCMKSPVAMIPEIAGHLIRAGGKRIRPMLTLSVARCFGYEGAAHIKLAAAVELLKLKQYHSQPKHYLSTCGSCTGAMAT